jgi:DNA-binding LacI/PurR family transcriptional regulator
MPSPSQELIDFHVSQMCARSVDAIAAMDDMWAIQVIKALKKIGKRVPEDVAVVGFGNAKCAEIYEPGITTVEEDPPELSEMVVAKLISMISGEKIPNMELHTMLLPKLVIRESA